MPVICFIILAVLAYFLGSVPFGLVYSRLRGVDIRKVGSGNIGATNVSRQFGFLGGFVPIFILDFIKGALPIIIVRIFGTNGIDPDIAMITVGLIAILGHMFPIYLGFKGGKGVATTGGVLVMVAPLEAGITLAIFIFVLFLYRIVKILTDKDRKDTFFKLLFKNLQAGVALSSMSSFLFFPVSVIIFELGRTVILVVSVLVCGLIIFQHRSNIAKMIKGENR